MLISFKSVDITWKDSFVN